MNKAKKIQEKDISSKIIFIRGQQVMLDRDLANMYSVETRVLNQATKRNKERFPPDFLFELNKKEIDSLVSQNVIPSIQHLGGSTPKAFTEQGVAMLSAVLKSTTAVNVSIDIIKSFVMMRRFLKTNKNLFQRMNTVEQKIIEQDTNINKLLEFMKYQEPEKGVFFEGELFDAHTFISKIIKQARQSIILLNNYIDEHTLTILDKRKKGVQATIYTKQINQKTKLDIQKHNEQYQPVIIKELKVSHDRFLIIDNNITYHIGSSIKDLGKKWFAFSKFNKESTRLLEKLK